jgi:hypothetical protein
LPPPFTVDRKKPTSKRALTALNFAGIQAMLDVYADTGMISKKLDANQFKHATIVAPIE